MLFVLYLLLLICNRVETPNMCPEISPAWLRIIFPATFLSTDICLSSFIQAGLFLFQGNIPAEITQIEHKIPMYKSVFPGAWVLTTSTYVVCDYH